MSQNAYILGTKWTESPLHGDQSQPQNKGKNNAKMSGKQSTNVTSGSMSNHAPAMSIHMANHLPKHCQIVS